MDAPSLKPSPESQSLWYYADESNQPVGPLPFSTLQQLASVGVIQPETHVLEKGDAEWKKFDSIVPPTVRVETQPAHAETAHASTHASAKENAKGNREVSPPTRAESVHPLSRKDRKPITAKGFGETITVLEDKIQISRNFLTALGKAKLTEIPLSAIRAIRWKAPGSVAQGHIQFLLEGTTQAASGFFAIGKDVHAVAFSRAELGAFQSLKREVEQKLGFPISEETPVASECADIPLSSEDAPTKENASDGLTSYGKNGGDFFQNFGRRLKALADKRELRAEANKRADKAVSETGGQPTKKMQPTTKEKTLGCGILVVLVLLLKSCFFGGADRADKGMTTGISYDQILGNGLADFFAMKQADDVDGRTRYMGGSNSGAATIELIGEKSNLYHVTLLMDMAQKDSQTATQHSRLFKTLLGNIDSAWTWEERVSWLAEALEARNKKGPVETSVIRGNKKITLKQMDSAGLVMITIAPAK